MAATFAADVRVQAVGSWVGPSVDDLCWVFKNQGSSGPDQWHSDELKHLPFEAVVVWRTLTQWWPRAGLLPEELCESRMVNFPKENSCLRVILDGAHTRPISIPSVFWRVYAKAMLQSNGMQAKKLSR